MKGFAGKRILLLVENNPVPFDKRIWREAQTLKETGAKVFVISPKTDHYNESHETIEGIEVLRYNAYFSKGSKFGYFREYIDAIIKMFYISFRLFIKEGFHVVHVANPPDLLWIIASFYKLFGTKFIFDEHDLGPESFISRFNIKTEKKNNLIYKILILMEKISYRLSDTTIVTNESYKSNAINRGKIRSEKIFIVRNGPDMRKFNKVTPNKKWKFGFNYMAAYIGIMGVQDGVDILINAMKYIVNILKRKDICFVLIGSGDEAYKLKSLTKELDLDKYIKFTGRIPDKPALEILSTANVCLSPDPKNPLNEISTMNKIMEYMVCEKPIVSFPLKEAIFSAGDSALYVTDSSEKFAEGLIYLINHPNIAKKMGKFGYERVKNHLRWEKQQKYLINAYKYLRHTF